MVPPQGSTRSGQTKCLLPRCLHWCPSGNGDEERREQLWEGQAIEEPNTQGRAPAQPSPARGPKLSPTPPWANSWHLPGGSSPQHFLVLLITELMGEESRPRGKGMETSEGKGEDTGCLEEPWEGRK